MDDSREESLMWTLKKTLSLRTQRGRCHWAPLENSINEKPEEDIIIITYRQLYQWRSVGASEPSMTFAPQIILFGFLVMVHDRVGDGNKISKETFDAWRPRFHATGHLKIDAKEFFMWFMSTI